MVSLVKIIIERSFVPQVPFEKFSTVSRGERPDRNEVYEVVVRFECAEVLFALWLSCYEIYSLEKKHDNSRMRLKKSRLRTAYRASSYSQHNWLCGSHL